MRERRAGLFHEDTPCIREFHNPSLVASEQVKSMLCFEIGNLFAESHARKPRPPYRVVSGCGSFAVISFYAEPGLNRASL
jgi:hypothetical protein